MTPFDTQVKGQGHVWHLSFLDKTHVWSKTVLGQLGVHEFIF